MGEYTSKLAQKIKNTKGNDEGIGGIRQAEYVSPTAIRIGGQLFSHNVHRNPQCTVMAGDNVLVAHIGPSFYIICKVV